MQNSNLLMNFEQGLGMLQHHKYYTLPKSESYWLPSTPALLHLVLSPSFFNILSLQCDDIAA